MFFDKNKKPKITKAQREATQELNSFLDDVVDKQNYSRHISFHETFKKVQRWEKFPLTPM